MSLQDDHAHSVALEDEQDTDDAVFSATLPWLGQEEPADGPAVHQQLLAFVQRELSTEERLIIMLRYCEALTMTEIAAVLRKPVGDVTHVHDQIVARVKEWMTTREGKEALVTQSTS